MSKILYKFESIEPKVTITMTQDDTKEHIFFVKRVDSDGKELESRSFGRHSYALHWFWDRTADFIEKRHAEVC